MPLDMCKLCPDRPGRRISPTLMVLSLGAGLVVATAPCGLRAQQPSGDSLSAPEDITPQSEPADDGSISPGGAFLRSVLIPGWGHVANESYGRGGFYVAAQTAGLWMMLQTRDRRAEATRFLDLERELAETRLRANGMTDPDSIAIAVDSDEDVQTRQERLASRDQQVEDWSALSIFLVLLGAADAFVAAHLAEYPEPLALRVQPLGLGRTELSISVPSSYLGKLFWMRGMRP